MADALYTIALRIEQAWPDRPAAINAYLAALRCMACGNDRVGALTGRMAVRRVLTAARDWVGPLAEDLKRQLDEAADAEAPPLPLVTLPADHCPVCGARLDEVGAAVSITHMSGMPLLMCAVCAHLTGEGRPTAVYRHGSDGWTSLDQEPDR